MKRLATLLTAAHPATQTIAYWRNEPVSIAQFEAQVSRLATDLSMRRAKRAGLFCEDTYVFTVGFFAALHAGVHLILPPNLQDGLLAEIAAETDLVLTDLDLPLATISRLHPIACKSAAGAPLKPLNPIDRGKICLELFTSGSTGERRRIGKSLAHLEDEIDVLEATWGRQLENATIFSTVSHQHIYGLLFRCLWPIQASRPFESATFLHPEPLFARMSRFPVSVLVSSPAHLKRIPEFFKMLNFQALRGPCRAIFSSGGPLPEIAAKLYEPAIGTAPIEVLGSTETGGVAWRQQPNETWLLLPEVEMEIAPQTSLLRVRSPFVSEADRSGWFTMGDAVEAIPGEARQFHLLGRRDRIVKIEENRLSLPEMEGRLLEHPGVADCVVLQLPASGGRESLGAVVVMKEKNAGDPVQDLKNYLGEFYKPVLIPRDWAMTDKIPEDAQGKRSPEALSALFARDTRPK